MKPILLDKDNVLIDGYITYIVAKTFNYEELEAITIVEVLDALDCIKEGFSNMCKSLGEAFIGIGKALTGEDK